MSFTAYEKLDIVQGSICESVIITLDTERSSPAEIRRAIKVLVALEESPEEIRDTIRELYDVLAAKVNAERRVYRSSIRKPGKESQAAMREGFAKGGSSFQGVET